MDGEHTTTFNTCHMLKGANKITRTFVDAFGPLEVQCERFDMIFKKIVIGQRPETVITKISTGEVYTNVSKFCQ